MIEGYRRKILIAVRLGAKAGHLVYAAGIIAISSLTAFLIVYCVAGVDFGDILVILIFLTIVVFLGTLAVGLKKDRLEPEAVPDGESS